MSNNISNNKIKIRRNKKILFENERNFIISQLILFMNLDNDNSILLVELQDNLELKNKIIEFSNDIKKYYRCSSWGYFTSLNKGYKGDEITLLRSIFKDHGYNIFSKDVITSYNGVKQRYTKLFFLI
jgi:hypothetical protein